MNDFPEWWDMDTNLNIFPKRGVLHFRYRISGYSSYVLDVIVRKTRYCSGSEYRFHCSLDYLIKKGDSLIRACNNIEKDYNAESDYDDFLYNILCDTHDWCMRYDYTSILRRMNSIQLKKDILMNC